MRRPVPNQPDPTPLLLDIVLAARHAGRYRQRAGRRSEAEALKKLGRLARVAAPARGVLAPVEDDLCQEIHRIARRHLGYARASQRFRDGLRLAETFAARDAIETAHAEVIDVTSMAYYYAGLAFGLTFQDRSRR